MSGINDDGEFIPHAKKHRTGSVDRPGANHNRLAEIWPEPDWCALAASGRYAPNTLAALAATYWSLGTGPLKESCFEVQQHEWPALYDAAIAIVRQVFEEATTENMRQLYARAQALAGLNSESPLRDRMRLAAAGRFGGRSLKYPFSLLPRLKWLLPSMPDLGWPASDDCLKTNVTIAAGKSGAAPEDPVWMVITESPRCVVHKEFRRLSRQAALEGARSVIAQTLMDNARGRDLRKAVTARASVDLAGRTGPDCLQGRDITTQELMRTYRLRGIQFGEALSDKERQRWLNEAYCALADLARVLGLQPAWIGLGGRGKPTLALAIGARGQGGAMAHYETDLRVFNLTRDRGAGSLAHEWGHALDQHLLEGTFSDAAAYGARTGLLSASTWVIEPERVERIKAWQAYMALINAIDGDGKNPFMEQARGIEALKGARKRYWTAPEEMFARSFEAYVQDCLENAGQSSPWLVHGTLPQDQPEPRLSAYPLAPQREQFAQRWGEFLRELSQKSN